MFDLVARYQDKLIRSITTMAEAAHKEAHEFPEDSPEYRQGHVVANTLGIVLDYVQHDRQTTQVLQDMAVSNPDAVKRIIETLTKFRPADDTSFPPAE